MLNLMSYFYQQKDIDIFLENYKKEKEKIFAEIYSYLGEKEFYSQKEFEDNYMTLLKKEPNQKKILSSGLILQIGLNFSNLELTDQYSTFNISIDFIKKITFYDKTRNKQSEKYIISEIYYYYYYQKIRKKQIKYKFKDNSEESSLLSENFESKIIYNPNLEYISLASEYDEIYNEILDIFKQEKQVKIIKANNIFNKYRILNFPDIDKNNVDKIELKPASFSDSCYGYKILCYNKKRGLTLNTQKLLIILYQKDIKNFYCNIEFLYQEEDTKKIRNYLFFYLAYLFGIDEQDKYKIFIETKILDIIYKFKGEKLISKLLELICTEFKDTFKLYIDNIKTISHFNIIKHLTNEYGEADIMNLIQINDKTLCLLPEIKFRIIENNMCSSSIDDELEYYIPLKLGEINIKKIKNDYSKKLEIFFDKFDYEHYLHLLQVKYLIDQQYFNIYSLLDIDSFLEFLLVKIESKRKCNISFRNDLIKELFNNYYYNYITKFKNINNTIFYNITKSEEGINLEKQIIFDLLVKDINIEKVNVDKIFTIKTIPDIIFDNAREYLFIQDKSNAPYYDIAYLYYYNGNIILKVCQIGINKTSDDLKKMNKDFIIFDLVYFCQKLEYEKGIKIDKIQFCIITTFNALQEYESYLKGDILSKDRKYKNFEKVKKFCKVNNFIFLIFNTMNSEIYYYDENNNLKKTDLKNDSFQYNIKNIFINSEYIQNTEKIEYNYNPKKPRIIGEINIPKNFNINNLNNEYKYKIVDNKIIYKLNLTENNNNIKENMIDKENETKNLIPKDENIEKTEHKKNCEDEKIEDSKKRKRDEKDDRIIISKNKRKKLD